ncbi:MAG: response regulator [Nitrospinota bacterium]
MITDLHMPVMDGFQLIRKMREEVGTYNIPIIVNSAISSSASPSDGTMIDSRTYAFELGADDFIEKPLVPDDFVPRVSKYLP